MDATAPAWKPQIDRSEPPRADGFWQRPRVRATLRALYVVGGVLVAAAAFVLVGFWAAMFGCYGVETDGLCVSAEWLIPVLEWPIFLLSVAAPLAGGIAGYVRRTAVWLCAGVATSVLMGYLIVLVSATQTSALS
ncbi:MAG TPA: hypothetical protein VMY78_00325 [Solirubrobacteraceae bacterium]|nr:hypothetical protein [Solirubrobacteraceae bacterium]